MTAPEPGVPSGAPRPPAFRAKPEGAKEFTLRAVLAGVAVALILGASYPYIVLKLGFGPNVSVVAAFLGFIFLGLVRRDFNRWENNVIQSAGTAAAQTAFLCVLLAAFDMLAASKVVAFDVTLSPMQSFLWLTTAGLLGVFLAVPFRRHYVVDEKLTYADGVAAAETILVLDGRGKEAGAATRALALGAIASAALMLLTRDAYVFDLFDSTALIPAAVSLGGAAINTLPMQAMGVGVNWSLLSVGSGMLIGMRINLSMLLGTALSWMVAPYVLHDLGIVAELKKNDVLFWVMWPATGMMVCGGLAGLALRWRVLAKTFRQLKTPTGAAAEDLSPRWVVLGAIASAVALVLVQKVSLGLDAWVTVTAILLSLPLMLVGLRVLGETNWGPISALSNLMQGVFGALAPGHVAANMLASGTTGTVAACSEAIMQTYKTGAMVGSTPKHLTYAQLLCTPVGALAVSCMYPLLVKTYGIVGDGAKLSSPISRKWAGFAEILSRGFSALPPYALHALLVGSALGVLLAFLETSPRWRKRIPSPTGVGIGMLVPAAVIVTMCIGGVVEWIWSRRSKATSDVLLTPLASGLIAGEAIGVLPVSLHESARRPGYPGPAWKPTAHRHAGAARRALLRSD
ncbi:MAG: OPT/YSL family transporter, partial [Planctomycetes bacterium]|nr:OPT/YSL family transporter [Planctomycetota bacterium]